MEKKRFTYANVRITPESLRALEEEAGRVRWSVPQLIGYVLDDWLMQRDENGGALAFILRELSPVKDSVKDEE